MALNDVEIVRAMIDAFQEGDAEGALSCYSEDVVFQPLVAGPYHGRAGVAEQMIVWMEEFDDYWFESEKLIDAGEKVVLLWRHGGKGKTSGVATEDAAATLFTVRDGLISHARVFAGRDEALAAAGVAE